MGYGSHILFILTTIFYFKHFLSGRKLPGNLKAANRL